MSTGDVELAAVADRPPRSARHGRAGAFRRDQEWMDLLVFGDPTSGRKLCWGLALGKCSAAGGCKMVHAAGSILTELRQKLEAADDGPVAPARRPSVTSGAPSRTSSALAARETVLRERTIVVMREARERAARASKGVYRQTSQFCVGCKMVHAAGSVLTELR